MIDHNNPNFPRLPSCIFNLVLCLVKHQQPCNTKGKEISHTLREKKKPSLTFFFNEQECEMKKKYSCSHQQTERMKDKHTHIHAANQLERFACRQN